MMSNGKRGKKGSLPFYGNEIVANTRRLALMNMLLYGIGDFDAEPSIETIEAALASFREVTNELNGDLHGLPS